jgi:ABC-type glycerol-3-phosphate transport system substrate-binding protein
MAMLTRRSVLRGSMGLAAALARPHVANAAALTAELWWVQGFAQEEDIAFKKLIADYEKASGNKIEDSIVPFAPMRQKAVSAITAGVVPDIMELADFSFLPLKPGPTSSSMSVTSSNPSRRNTSTPHFAELMRIITSQRSAPIMRCR